MSALHPVCTVCYGATLLVLIFLFLWRWQRKSKRVALDENFSASLEQQAREIKRCEQEIVLLPLRSHVAGMVVDSMAKLLRNLHSKYNGMRSFLGNLSVWP